MWKCIHIERGGGEPATQAIRRPKRKRPFEAPASSLRPLTLPIIVIVPLWECAPSAPIHRLFSSSISSIYVVPGACGMPAGGRAKERKKKLWVQGLCVAHARYEGQANKCTQ